MKVLPPSAGSLNKLSKEMRNEHFSCCVLITLKLEAVSSSETPMNLYKTTRPHMQDDDSVHSYCYENLRPHIVRIFSSCLQVSENLVQCLGLCRPTTKSFWMFAKHWSHQLSDPDIVLYLYTEGVWNRRPLYCRQEKIMCGNWHKRMCR